jgi:hypothetical protein
MLLSTRRIWKIMPFVVLAGSLVQASDHALHDSVKDPPPISSENNPTAVNPEAKPKEGGTVRVNPDLMEYYRVKAVDSKTKHAKYMTREEAIREGYHPAKE